MYLDGRTQGKPWHADPVDTDNPAMEKVWTRVKSTGSWANCTSADRMRLRRVPKWLTIRINMTFLQYRANPDAFDMSRPDVFAKVIGATGYDGHTTPTQQRLFRQAIRKAARSL